MKPKHLVSILLIGVVLAMLMRKGGGVANIQPLVYKDSLEKVAAQINGEELTLRELAVYVGTMEYNVQQEALVYDPDDPNRYWSMRIKGGFTSAVARNNTMQMALHDALFYQMAQKEEITLDADEKKQVQNKLEDFWEDLTERQGEQALGISRKEAESVIEKIACAQKYQAIYAELNNRSYKDYDFTGKPYQKLLKKQDYRIYNGVWNRVSFGNVTYNNKKKED